MPRPFFLLAAGVHLVVAGVHVAALARPSGDASPARHALFVVVNVAVAIGFVRRPRPFAPCFTLLTLQQLASHGAAAAHAWRSDHRVDVASLLVLAWMPTASLLLWRDRRAQRSTS